MDLTSIIQECAPFVAARTARALVQVESGFDPLAIHVNGGALERQPRSLAEAVLTAKSLASRGWDFDIGLAQINVRNARHFGVPIEQVFDPCTNLRLMQRILQECFAQARSSSSDSRAALLGTLSCYNTGDSRRGLRSGYVSRVVTAARKLEARPEGAVQIQQAQNPRSRGGERQICKEGGK